MACMVVAWGLLVLWDWCVVESVVVELFVFVVVVVVLVVVVVVVVWLVWCVCCSHHVNILNPPPQRDYRRSYTTPAVVIV